MRQSYWGAHWARCFSPVAAGPYQSFAADKTLDLRVRLIHIVAKLRRPSEDQVTPAGGQQPLSGKKVSPAQRALLSRVRSLLSSLATISIALRRERIWRFALPLNV
jgi:hypothetical protein